jgi:tripartite-type tricarboxylate transporter receptor subunit TctC
MQTLPYVLLGPTSQGQKTLAEMIASAKAKPGSLTLANGGIGTSTHLPALMFAQQAGIDVVHVPYKGNAAALPDVLGGRADGFFDTAAVAIAMMKEGKLRPYGVTSTKRMPQLPDVPTLAEQGLPNFNFTAYIALFAPAATPADVVKRISEAVRAASKTEACVSISSAAAPSPGPEVLRNSPLSSSKMPPQRRKWFQSWGSRKNERAWRAMVARPRLTSFFRGKNS